MKGLVVEHKGGTSMSTNSRAMRPGLAFVVVALFALAPAVASARPVRDSEEFSRFLAGAKTEAAQVQQTAEEMFALKFSKVSWHTQAAKLEELKTHVNKLGEFVVNMNNAEAPSPWQSQAIRDVTPMVEELAANVTMGHLSSGRQPGCLRIQLLPGIR
jgi:hypothetical protein